MHSVTGFTVLILQTTILWIMKEGIMNTIAFLEKGIKTVGAGKDKILHISLYIWKYR